MARKAPLAPPTPETLDAMLQLIRNSPEPLLAKTLVAQLAAIQPVTETQLTAVLERYATEGPLYKYPGKGKGKPTFWDRNLLDLVDAAVLTAVRESHGTISAKELASQISFPKLTEAQVVEALKSAVAEKKVFEYPGKTAAAKPRYWHQDPVVVGRQAALEAIRGATSPITAKEMMGWWKTAVVFTESNLTAILEELAASGQIHKIQATSAKGKNRYWDHDVLEFASRNALQAVNQKGPQTLASLKKELKGLSDPQIKQVLDDLQTTGKLLLHPVGAGVKQAVYGTRPPVASAYLKEVGVQLSKVVALLKAAHVPIDELRRAAVQLIEDAGISFGTSLLPPPTATPATTAPSAVDLIALMKRIEPAAERGALVGARDLRRAAHLQKVEFDQAVLSLARQGRLSLHHHDYASSLNQAERDELVTDGNGTFYVGMALRSD